MSTPNRTTNSKLLLVGLAKATGQIPRGTHGWTRSITSEELKPMVGGAGPEVVDTTGFGADHWRGFTLGGEMSPNY